jgi:tetratricopeptide (TPR) repeat protein
LAAYDIARQYELVKDFRKALFYARIARDRSLQIGSADWIASSHNQMGNALLAQCRVDEAVEEYEQALAAMPDGPSIWRARILDNLGYCRVLQRRPRQGFALLYASLRVLRRHGARRYEVSTRLDLSFAHLEARRLPTAHRHARAALALAEEAGDADSIKNALFLLGEIASVGGAEDEAANHFGRLQREFFPQAGYLTGFLQAVNVLGLINLHA